MNPFEYLEQSVRYSNKVAKNIQDDFPTYISATTDFKHSAEQNDWISFCERGEPEPSRGTNEVRGEQ